MLKSVAHQAPSHWVEHDRRVRPYLWSNRLLGWAQTAVGLLFVFWIFQSGAYLNWEVTLANRVGTGLLRDLVYFWSIALLWEVISFPFSLGHYYVEKRFQLSRQSIGSWLGDKVKALLVGGVISIIVLAALRGIILWTGAHWWWVSAIAFTLFTILLAQLAPVLLIPLFMKMKPMEDGPLKQRLLMLCQRFQINVKEVFHLGLGEKTEKGNAAFLGLGRTKRICIGDTLYEKFPVEEVEAVFAHELGHQVHHDLWRGIFLSTVFLFGGFYLSNFLCLELIFPLQGLVLPQPSALFVFFVVFSLVQWPVGILTLGHSRWREREADSFAANTIGTPKELASALERLTIQNFGMFCPNPWLEFFTYSHPSPGRRILRLRG